MKQLFALLFLCLSLSACKKQYVDPSSFVYCRFTLLDKDNQIQREYYLRDGKLYNHNPIVTGTGIMAEDQYLKAKTVMDKIPTVLTKDPSVTYSCFCNSFEKIVLSYYENDREYKYQIDLDAKNPPRKVTKFANKVRSLIKELEE